MLKRITNFVYYLWNGETKQEHDRRQAEQAARQAAFEAEQKSEAAKREAEEARREAYRREQQAQIQAADAKRLAHERAERAAAQQRAIEEEAAEKRRIANPFQLGGRYENRKGPFTVIALSEDKITIKWDSDEKPFTDTIASQARILRNMQRGDVCRDDEAAEEDECDSKRGDSLEEYQEERRIAQAEINAANDGPHRHPNKEDPATNNALFNYYLHQDDGSLDAEDLTDFEREELRYNGGKSFIKGKDA
jgi:hypothetical protein